MGGIIPEPVWFNKNSGRPVSLASAGKPEKIQGYPFNWTALNFVTKDNGRY
jgi:hypothetical protein